MSQLKVNIETLFPQFQLVGLLRQNQYKKTVQVKRGGHNYIMRIFNLNGANRERVQQIIKMLTKISKLNCPNVTKFYEATFDQELTYLGVVSEFLDTPIQFPKEEQIWKIIKGIINALSLFHPKRIHGKISLSNIFMGSDNNVVLGEMNIPFYLCRENYQDVYLLAPEFLKYKIYDEKSDIWMLGYLVYNLMFNQPPVVANNIGVLHKKIIKGIQINYNPNFSLNLNNLLKLLLLYDQELRISTEQITQYLQQVEQGDVNLVKIFPKFKLDKIQLHKKREEKKSEPVKNVVYLSEEGQYKQPLFRPSKIKKLVTPTTHRRSQILFFDMIPPQKSTNALQLPKVTQFQKSKLNTDARKDIIGSLQETQRLQQQLESSLEEQPFTKYSMLPKRFSDQNWKKSPNRIMFEQQILNIARQRSQKKLEQI